MKPAGVAGAALIALAAIWAGARMHVHQQAAADRAGTGAAGTPLNDAAHGGDAVAVPAGKASPPSASDRASFGGTAASDDGAFSDGGGPSDGAYVPPKIPDRLPIFSLADRAGKSTSIASWAGKSLVINFWATWCAPCRREIPLLETLHTEWVGRGVTIVGIAVDHRDQVLKFADQFKIPYPLLIGEQDALDAAAAFGMASPVFPFTVFTDRRGEVVALFVGELHRPQADLILSAVQNLNDGRVRLPQARHTIAEGLRALTAKRAG